MVALQMPARDPTLDEIQRLYTLKLIAENDKRSKRKARLAKKGQRYIGASVIGHECDRHIYFDSIGAPADPPYRWYPNAGILAAEDGHRSEPIMAARLRMVQGIELYTHRPDVKPKKQFGFDFGFLRGSYDGILRGLLQAPATWHIWDHKRANEKKFKKLKELVQIDEKAALQLWDKGYYAQQVIYMEAEELERSYLTCSTDGFTDVTSVRTNADPKYAKALIAKAKRITSATQPPMPISKQDNLMPCLFCKFKGTCRSQP